MLQKLINMKKNNNYKEAVETIISLNDWDTTEIWKLKLISDFTEYYNGYDDEETFKRNYMKRIE